MFSSAGIHARVELGKRQTDRGHVECTHTHTHTLKVRQSVVNAEVRILL